MLYLPQSFQDLINCVKLLVFGKAEEAGSTFSYFSSEFAKKIDASEFAKKTV